MISSELGQVTVTTPQPSPVTELLAAAGRGDGGAHERLWALVYDELHRVARRQMADEAPGHTLQTTALVNEAYLRLIGDVDVQWANRRHFFAAAAKAMRRIRIDDARRRGRLKRGGPQPGNEASRQQGNKVDASAARAKRVPLDEAVVFDDDPAEVLAVDEALSKLEQKDPRKAEIVQLRYFAGLTVDETADALGISPRTVDREWVFARAWLKRNLSGE